MLRIFFLCLFPLLSFMPFSASAKQSSEKSERPYSFIITKHQYKLSDQFQISSPANDTYPGAVKKSAFRIRTNYDLSNKDGWQATGITRLLSAGTIYTWATDIDIYDTRGVQIAMIDGSFATLESARFDLYHYDKLGRYTLVGIAYATPDFLRFAIYDANNSAHVIAELNRQKNDDSWRVNVHYASILDDRLVRIFAAFVSDKENSFLNDLRLRAEGKAH